MEKEIIGTDIGPEAHVDLKVVDGQVVIEVKQQGADGFVSLQAGIGPKAFLDKLKAMIPGTLDDMAIDAMEAALGLK